VSREEERNVANQKAGRPRISFAEPEHTARTLDRVVFAPGGTTPTNFLQTLGIAVNGDGPVFDEMGATNVPGLYLIGDLVVGRKGGSIITAFNSAVRAMEGNLPAPLILPRA
jgi:thioredoxin reductase (NADPH)